VINDLNTVILKTNMRAAKDYNVEGLCNLMSILRSPKYRANAINVIWLYSCWMYSNSHYLYQLIFQYKNKLHRKIKIDLIKNLITKDIILYCHMYD
jgi:hypothetical protein